MRRTTTRLFLGAWGGGGLFSSAKKPATDKGPMQDPVERYLKERAGPIDDDVEAKDITKEFTSATGAPFKNWPSDDHVSKRTRRRKEAAARRVSQKQQQFAGGSAPIRRTEDLSGANISVEDLRKRIAALDESEDAMPLEAESERLRLVNKLSRSPAKGDVQQAVAEGRELDAILDEMILDSDGEVPLRVKGYKMNLAAAMNSALGRLGEREEAIEWAKKAEFKFNLEDFKDWEGKDRRFFGVEENTDHYTKGMKAERKPQFAKRRGISKMFEDRRYAGESITLPKGMRDPKWDMPSARYT